MVSRVVKLSPYFSHTCLMEHFRWKRYRWGYGFGTEGPIRGGAFQLETLGLRARFRWL